MKIPYWPGWLAVLACALLALVPSYAYVRLIPIVAGAVTACYLGLALLGRVKPKLAKLCRAVLTGLVIIGVTIVAVTGGAILWAGADGADPQCEYIVVLGAKVKSGGPTASLQERIDRAYEYLVAHPQTVAVVSGGQGADEPISEARCMYEALVAMGIEPERVWMEDKATSTWENLKFSLDIIEERTGTRPDSLGVVSSEYHLLRTTMQAADRGLELEGIPARTGSFDRWLHYFIREIAGVWHYLILGGQYT